MGAPAAHAAITVGSTLSPPIDSSIGGDIVALQGSPSNLMAVSPVAGTVVGGSVKQGSGGALSWGSVSLRVVHPSPGGLYQVIARGPDNAIPAGVGIFPVSASVPIAKGDIVAVQATNAVVDADTAGSTYLWNSTAGFPVGGPPIPLNAGGNRELLYNARIDPSNTFTIGAPVGGKGGKATVVVTVPNPGTIEAGSVNDKTLPVKATEAKKKKKKAKPLLVHATAAAASPGQVTLTLQASKAGRNLLRQKGKLKTTAKIVYTPTSGSAGSQTIKLKLKP